MDENDLKNSITQAVQKAWDDGFPLLLSDLGTLRDGQITISAKNISGGLSRFIKSHLEDDLLIIKHSSVPAAIAVIPKNEETENIEDFDDILNSRLSSNTRDNNNLVFIRRFWAAFRKRLPENHRRFIDTETASFTNLPATDSPTENLVEIPACLIASDDDVTDKEVYKNIEKWARDKNQNLETFTQKKGRSPLGQAIYSSKGKTLLDEILNTLSESDLRRIEMPLDIVSKLRRS